MSDVRYVRCSSCQSIIRSDASHCSFCGFEVPRYHEYEEHDGLINESSARTLGNRISSIQNVRSSQTSQPTSSQHTPMSEPTDNGGVPEYIDASLTNEAPEHLPHPIQCFLDCYQRILMYQLDYLVEQRGFSPLIKHCGGQVWFRYLDVIRIERRFAVEDVVEFYRQRKSSAHEVLSRADMAFEAQHIEQQVADTYKKRMASRKERQKAQREGMMINDAVNRGEMMDLPTGYRVAHLDVEKELVSMNITSGGVVSDDMSIQQLLIKKSSDIMLDIATGKVQVPKADNALSYMQLLYRSYLIIDEGDYENNFMWSSLPTPADTILFCYLACLKAREPIMLNEIRRWAQEGSFPYRNVCGRLMKDSAWRKLAANTLYFRPSIVFHNMHRPFVTQYSYIKMFRDATIPSPKVLWKKLAYMYESGLSISIPRVHCESYIHRMCTECLYLSNSDPLKADIVRYTSNLIKLYHNIGVEEGPNMRSATMDFWFSKEERSEQTGKLRQIPPEIQISAYMIIALKLRFGLCENEALTDKVWTLMVLGIIMRSNEKHEELLGPLMEKFQLLPNPSLFQNRSLTTFDLLDIMSLGTFNKYMKGEDNHLQSNYQAPHNVASTMVDYITSIKDLISKDGPSRKNPYSLLIEKIKNDPEFTELRSESKSDEKLLHYYSQRYIRYDALNKRKKLDEFALSEIPHRQNTNQDQFHIQYSFLAETMMAFHEFEPSDLHLLTIKLEELLFIAAGIGHEYNNKTNKVDC